jgi:hypothetical protein
LGPLRRVNFSRPPLRLFNLPGMLAEPALSLRLSCLLDQLETRRSEFDGLLKRMQKPQAKAAGHALFKATATELGRAAIVGARRRG